MDGRIDYTKYSLHELQDAATSIDRARFPINFSRLHAELASRGETVGMTPPPALSTKKSDPVRTLLKAPAGLLGSTIPLSIVVTVLEWDYAISKYSPLVIVETQLLTIAVTVWLLYFMMRGRNWARLAILILTALGLPFYIPALIATFFRSSLSAIIGIVELLLTVTALYMLFTEPARREFQRVQAP